jgi:hypothetical protein
MLLKMVSNQADKDISAEVAINSSKAKKEILNYRIKFGKNMFMVNRQPLN